MNDEAVHQVLQAYGLQAERLLAVQKGYRNESHAAELAGGRWANLIIYKQEPEIVARIRRANAVADYLAGQGFAARATLDPRVMRVQVGDRSRYAALYTYLSGHTIPWEAYTMAHLKQLGQTMSDMHALLQAMPAPPSNHAADECAALIHRMQAYFTSEPVSAALASKLNLHISAELLPRWRSMVLATKQLRSQHALHMDFVRGNILFDEHKHITGVLDFEKTAYGSPLFDIARTLAFLFVDCKDKTPLQVRKYFLYSGYHAHGRARLADVPLPGEHSLLWQLVQLFLLHDFYKFLRHNPYEFLPQNEHFVRTRDLLVQQHIISMVQ